MDKIKYFFIRNYYLITNSPRLRNITITKGGTPQLGDILTINTGGRVFNEGDKLEYLGDHWWIMLSIENKIKGERAPYCE
jgi:signal peptidase I